MSFFLNYFNRLSNKPKFKYFLNIFFLINIQYFSLKQLNCIHVFYNLRNYLQIKFFKFNYNYYYYCLVYFFVVNLVLQLCIVLLF